MRTKDLLKPQSILLHADITEKQEAIRTLIELHDQAGNLSDKEEYTKGILAREEESTTAVGEGIAIPHCKSPAVKTPGLTAMTVDQGIEYGAPDGKPSNLLFMIAAPMDGDLHLEVLSRLMMLLMDLDLRAKLLAADTPEEFLQAIDDAETAKFPDEAEAAPAEEAPSAATHKILAVTACPTGIAHTYMAAEALEQQGEKMGIWLKAETNGSGGAKNVLTPEEIAEADGIIVAADKNVKMARFDGKPVVITKVADGINKPEELISRILNGEAPIYHHQGGAEEDSSGAPEGESIGRKIYKDLMTPRNSDFGTYTAAAAFFKTVGGYAFSFMLPVLAGFISMSIADRPGLAVGFVGGYIATVGSTFADPAGQAAAVSGFLGALLAGFAGGYIVLLLKKIFAFLPRAIENMLPILILPLFGIILMGAFMCAVNPAVGALNTAMTHGLKSMGGTSQIILGIIVAGMMAIDMGGPFNKAAYVFGTAALTTGDFNIMAAVMIGGMVPPIAIALATTFFKNRWTPNELKSGPVNYIMGLCFITEGAIHYAAADPLRVIPSCVVGSVLAGALSMAFGCTLRAPHGGIFVFPVVGNVGGYLIALAAGAVAGMLMLALLKKKQPQSVPAKQAEEAA